MSRRQVVALALLAVVFDEVVDFLVLQGPCAVSSALSSSYCASVVFPTPALDSSAHDNPLSIHVVNTFLTRAISSVWTTIFLRIVSR